MLLGSNVSKLWGSNKRALWEDNNRTACSRHEFSNKGDRISIQDALMTGITATSRGDVGSQPMAYGQTRSKLFSVHQSTRCRTSRRTKAILIQPHKHDLHHSTIEKSLYY